MPLEALVILPTVRLHIGCNGKFQTNTFVDVYASKFFCHIACYHFGMDATHHNYILMGHWYGLTPLL